MLKGSMRQIFLRTNTILSNRGVTNFRSCISMLLVVDFAIAELRCCLKDIWVKLRNISRF